MKQNAYPCASYFQRCFRKMYGTILFVRVIPTVLISFACVLLLFLALVFGLNAPLILRYLLEVTLVSLACIVSSYLLWEKVIEHPDQSSRNLLGYLLACECVLPLFSVLLMTFSLHWAYLFFALYPLLFGCALLTGRSGQLMRFLLCTARLVQLAAAAVISLVYICFRLHGPNQITILLAVLLCCGLYFAYSLRFVYLLVRGPAPYTEKELSRFDVEALYAVPSEESEDEDVCSEEAFPGEFWEEEYDDGFPDEENFLDELPASDDFYEEDLEGAAVYEDLFPDEDMETDIDSFCDEDEEEYSDKEEEPPRETPYDGPGL